MEAEETSRIERSQRRVEAALAEMRKNCEQIKALADFEQRRFGAQKEAFSKVKEKLLCQLQEKNNPKVVLQNAIEIQKKLKAEKEKLSGAGKRLAEIRGRQQALLGRIAGEKGRLEKHRELVAAFRRSAASRLELHQFEAILEGSAAARAEQVLQDSRAGAVSERSIPEQTEWDLIAPAGGQGASLNSTVVAPEGATSASAAAESFGGKNGSRGSKESPPQKQGGTSGQAPRRVLSDIASMEELKARIETLCSWENGSGAGVILDYVTRLGRKLELKIAHCGANTVKVEIAPEYYRDRRALWEEKKNISAALSECGLAVSEIKVTEFKGG